MSSVDVQAGRTASERPAIRELACQVQAGGQCGWIWVGGDRVEGMGSDAGPWKGLNREISWATVCTELSARCWAIEEPYNNLTWNIRYLHSWKTFWLLLNWIYHRLPTTPRAEPGTCLTPPYPLLPPLLSTLPASQAFSSSRGFQFSVPLPSNSSLDPSQGSVNQKGLPLHQ